MNIEERIELNTKRLKLLKYFPVTIIIIRSRNDIIDKKKFLGLKFIDIKNVKEPNKNSQNLKNVK